MFGGLFQVFYPKICFACGNAMGQKLDHICLLCRHKLPRTNAHKLRENPIEKLFWGRLPLQRATAYLQFHKRGKVQKLIHHFKYKGVKEIGETLGNLAATELAENDFFENIDGIVPIPIHRLKLQKRGYNQSQFIARGVAQSTDIELYFDLVKKGLHTESQTRKGRFKRWQNVNSSFQLQAEEAKDLSGKHLLLVDDVLTTGSTIEACGKELLQIPDLKLSLLTMAFSQG